MMFLVQLLNTPTIVLIIILTIIILYLTRDKKKNLLHIPGPPPLPIIGNALLFAGPSENVYKAFVSLRAKYGKIFRIHEGMIPELVITAPEDVQKVLSSSVNLNKGFSYDLIIRPMIGNCLIYTPLDKWRSRRKLLTPAFHHRILEDFLFVMNDQAKILMKIIKEASMSGEQIDCYSPISNYALDVICETAMGKKIDAQTNPESSYIKAIKNGQSIAFNRF